MQTAKEIATEYGAGDMALELAILRHMEHHVNAHRLAEREACARTAEQWKSPEKLQNQMMMIGRDDAAKNIAAAIRARTI